MVGIAIQVSLGVIGFVISFRRSRTYYERWVGRSVATALALSLFCPLGALIVWGMTLGDTPGPRT